MAPLGGIGIDLYAPSLPAIANYFQTSLVSVKATIGIYLLGYGIGQFIFGILSDRFGRKPMLIMGLVLYAIASFLPTFAHGINFILICRFCQGFGAGAPNVLIKAIIGDQFTGIALTKIAAIVGIAWGLGPVIGPVIGGYLQYYFGWQMSFYFLTFYGILVLVLSKSFLHETNINRTPLHAMTLLLNSKKIISNQTFIASIFLILVGYSMIILFNVVGPFLIQDKLSYSAKVYGQIGFVLGIVSILGATLNRFLVGYFKENKIILLGLFCMLSAAFFLLITGWLKYTTLLLIVAPMCIIFLFEAFLFPLGMKNCISIFGDKKGLGSALMSGAVVISTALISLLGSFLNTSTQSQLALVYICLIMLVISMFLKE